MVNTQDIQAEIDQAQIALAAVNKQIDASCAEATDLRQNLETLQRAQLVEGKITFNIDMLVNAPVQRLTVIAEDETAALTLAQRYYEMSYGLGEQPDSDDDYDEYEREENEIYSHVKVTDSDEADFAGIASFTVINE